MRNIEDLEHFVLAEGETLILRCKRPFAMEELARMRDAIERYLPGRKVLVLPTDVEVMAGELEVWGAEDEARAEADAGTQEQVRRDNIQQAYNGGRLVWVNIGHEVFTVQVHANPHEFDWDRFTYGLTRKDVES